MGSRRKSRELAMQALFFMDAGRNDSEEMFELFCKNFKPPEKSFDFFFKIVKGVIASKSEIDSLIERHSSNWKISRMPRVDRNVMRVAVYELLFCEDIPPKVSINEAIEVAKKFGTDDSGAFINGILDGIRITRASEKRD